MVEGRLRGVLVAACGLVLAAASACNSDAPATPQSPSPSTPPASASATPIATRTPLLTASATAPVAEPGAQATGTWDARATVGKSESFYRIPCPGAADPARANPGQVFNLDTPAARACVLDAMRAAGTSEEARAFLLRYGTFLTAFEERGQVDLGITAAGWVNMGRPEPVFVNVRPDGMLPLNTLVNGGAPNHPAKQWLSHPAYLEALKGETGALAWPEYAAMSALDGRGGRQRFAAEIPVRKCRACETLTALVVVFEFGAGGDYLGWELRDPEPAGAPTLTPGPGVVPSAVP